MTNSPIIHATINFTDVPMNATFYARTSKKEYWWTKITKYSGKTINKAGKQFEMSFDADRKVIIEITRPEEKEE